MWGSLNVNDGSTDVLHVALALGLVFLLHRLMFISQALFTGMGLYTDNEHRFILIYYVVMSVGSLVAATWCLNDAFVQQIVSALMVGVGFGLRDVLMGALTGLRLKGMLTINKEATFRFPGGDASKSIEGTVTSMALLTVNLKNKGDSQTYTIPWLNLASAEVKTEVTTLITAKTSGSFSQLYFPVAKQEHHQ